MSMVFPSPIEKNFLEEHKHGIDNGTPEEVLNIIQGSFTNPTYVSRLYLVYALFSGNKVLVNVMRNSIDFSLEGDFQDLYTFCTLDRSSKGDKADIWDTLISDIRLRLPEDLAKQIYENVLVWSKRK